MGETWRPTSREGQTLRVSGNRVLRRIFGSKKDDVIVGWRKLYNDGFRNMYYLSNIFTMIKSKEDVMGRECSTYRGEGECIQGLGWKARRTQTIRKI
jgi:hypothetical protein